MMLPIPILNVCICTKIYRNVIIAIYTFKRQKHENQYHIVGTVPKVNRKIVETKSIPYHNIWLFIGT
jgi:hypothetical protein